jgi:hypothetical protein
MSVVDSRFPSPPRRGRRSRGELAERNREQARAQQHEAGCGQREEAVRYAIVGHEIIGSHHTPATLDAGPNSSKVSESLFRGSSLEVAPWFRGTQALERKPSNAWAMKMPALIRPKTAVTVSIIANFLCAPPPTERLLRCTVKRIPSRKRKSNPTDDFVQQMSPDWGAGSRKSGARPSQPLIHHPTALPISAVFAPRYVNTLMRKWAHRGRATAECREVGRRLAEW